MSFTQPKLKSEILERSELAVPATEVQRFADAVRSAADVVFLDLEDTVSPGDKERARRNAVQALNELDWGGKVMSVRLNGLGTPWMYRDVIDLVENCPRLDLLLIPKVGVPADLYALDMLVTQIETAIQRAKPVGFEILIETALGMANVEAIAQASARLQAMSFGVADYAASTQARTTAIGGVNPDYGVLSDRGAEGTREYFWADPWHAAQTRMLVACRAYGLRPIDGPFGDLQDPEGYLAAAKRAAVLGYEGKWAIHPSQVDLANKIFSPSEVEVGRAKRILRAMAEAAREGQGAVFLDGKLVDIASIRMAENIIKKTEAIVSKK